MHLRWEVIRLPWSRYIEQNLMLRYGSILEDSSCLYGTIRLLQETSQLVTVVSDLHHLTDMSDIGLQQLQEVREWFTMWERDISDSDVPKAKKNQMLMSWETREDIIMCCTSLIEIKGTASVLEIRYYPPDSTAMW